MVVTNINHRRYSRSRILLLPPLPSPNPDNKINIDRDLLLAVYTVYRSIRLTSESPIQEGHCVSSYRAASAHRDEADPVTPWSVAIDLSRARDLSTNFNRANAAIIYAATWHLRRVCDLATFDSARVSSHPRLLENIRKISLAARRGGTTSR